MKTRRLYTPQKKSIGFFEFDKDNYQDEISRVMIEGSFMSTRMSTRISDCAQTIIPKELA